MINVQGAKKPRPRILIPLILLVCFTVITTSSFLSLPSKYLSVEAVMAGIIFVLIVLFSILYTLRKKMLVCCLEFPESTSSDVLDKLSRKLDTSCAPDEVRELLHLQFYSRELPLPPKNDLKKDLERDLKQITTEGAFPNLWQATYRKSNNDHDPTQYLNACVDGLAQDLKDLAPNIQTDKLETFFTQCLLQNSIHYYRSIIHATLLFLINISKNHTLILNGPEHKPLTATLLQFDPSQNNLKLYAIHIPFLMRVENHSHVIQPGLVMQQLTVFNLATAAISIDFRFSCYLDSTHREFERMLGSSSMELLGLLNPEHLANLVIKYPEILENHPEILENHPEILENHPEKNSAWQIAKRKKDDNKDGKINHTDIDDHKKIGKTSTLKNRQMRIMQKPKHVFLCYLRQAFNELTIECQSSTCPESSQAFLIKPTAKSIGQRQMNAHPQEKKQPMNYRKVV